MGEKKAAKPLYSPGMPNTDVFDEAADNKILPAIGRKCHEKQIH